VGDSIIREMIQLQNIMEDRLGMITGTLGKMAEKLNQVEKRVTILEMKQESQAHAD
jgi:hypothetical protein